MTTPTPTEELVARFDRPLFRSEDDAFLVARVNTNTGPTTVKGAPDAGPPLKTGGTYRFHGFWQDHEQYGRGFAFVSYSAVVTGDRTGVIAYLVSVAENVGERRASLLWERYGVLAVASLRENPELVAEAGIMSLDAATEAAESLRQEVAFEGVRVDLLSLLSGRGFQLTPLIRELLMRWGRQSPERIRANPYDLLLEGFPSVGWKRCDRLYLDLGNDPAAMQRQALCALYHLREHADGNTWLPADQVGAAVCAAIGNEADPTQAIVTARGMRVIAVRRDGEGKVWLAEADNAQDEIAIAQQIKELTQWTPSQHDSPSSVPFATL